MSDKKEIRRLKNRASAEKSRQKKDDKITFLQQHVKEYQQRIFELRLENLTLKGISLSGLEDLTELMPVQSYEPAVFN